MLNVKRKVMVVDNPSDLTKYSMLGKPYIQYINMFKKGKIKKTERERDQERERESVC